MLINSIFVPNRQMIKKLLASVTSLNLLSIAKAPTKNMVNKAVTTIATNFANLRLIIFLFMVLFSLSLNCFGYALKERFLNYIQLYHT